MILFGPTIFEKKIIFSNFVCVCVCAQNTWNGSPRGHWDHSPTGLGKENKREYWNREKKGERKKWRPLFSFLSLTVSSLAAVGSRKEFLSLGVDSAPVKYLQLIMLQLLVSPFSLPSSQMIFKKISQFLKTIFSLLKKYWKAIGQPQGTLPVHLHSEQTDGQSTESKMRQARSLVPSGPLPYLPEGWGCHQSTHRHFFHLDPCPLPSMEMCGLLREAEPS